jgi:hypothetical protein
MTANSTKPTTFQKTIVFYLFIPIVIFIAGWVKPIFSIPIISLCIVYFLKNIKITSLQPLRIDKSIWVAILISFIITFLSGIGELGFQFNDYEKHNSIYKTLLANDYPVFLKKDNKTYMLCYYMAYYLPPVFGAKIINNASITPILSFLWGWLGITIIVFWLLKEGKLKLLVIFFAIGGISISSITKFWNDLLLYGTKQALFYTFNQPFGPETRVYLKSGEIEGSLSYFSNLFQLFWSPQHSIGAWLAGIILYKSFQEKSLYFTFLSGTALFFWSPMVFIGAILFYMLLIVILYPKYEFSKLELVVSALTFIIIFAFFKAHLPNHVSGFLFKYFTSFLDLFQIILFIILELAIGFMVLFLGKKMLNITDSTLLLFSIILLCLIPFYSAGLFNDFVLRTSTLPLFFFTYIIAKVFNKLIYSNFKYLAITIICLGSYESVVTLSTSLINLPHKQSNGLLQSRINISNYKIKFHNGEFDISDQYLGFSDSFFCKYLAKQTH